MLFFVLVSLIITVCVTVVHYNNHFESRVIKRYVNQRSKVQFKISPIDDQTYKFFPLAFFMYNIFIMILSIIIICIHCINYILSHNQHKSAIHLLFMFNLETKQQNNIHIIFANILSYSIMLLSLWDTLFAFHRYYSTYTTSENLSMVSTSQVLKLFLIYALPFIALYIIQINFFYWLFPALIFIKLCANIYCHYKFALIVTQEHSVFPEKTNSTSESSNLQLIKSIHFIWKTSLIYAILQSISLGLFITLIEYNINIIYFLPLLWCCISAIYCTNFIRNKRFFYKQRIKYCGDKAPPKPLEKKTPLQLKLEHISSDTGTIPSKLKLENISSNSLTIRSNDDTLVKCNTKIQMANTVKKKCEELPSDSDDVDQENKTEGVKDQNQKMIFDSLNVEKCTSRGNNVNNYIEFNMPLICDINDIHIVSINDVKLDISDDETDTWDCVAKQNDLYADNYGYKTDSELFSVQNVEKESAIDENKNNQNHIVSNVLLFHDMKRFGFVDSI